MTGAGLPERLSASVWRLELPSRTLPPFTTTNTYLIVEGGVAAIVDPGFEEESLPALARALAEAGARLVKAVLLTHTHGDHRAALSLVLSEFGAPAVYVHPLEHARLEGHAAVALVDDRSMTVGGALVKSLHTPGHSPGHLCFHLPEEGVLLAGDLAAGSGSVWVGVPEGDVGDYLASLDRIAALQGLLCLGPGHGAVVDEPYRRLAELRQHRLERERQVLAALEQPRSLSELRGDVYGELAERLRGPAEASLLAHLRKLMAEMRVVHLGSDSGGPFVVRR
jgi:ribonuclease/clavin/mitogillin